MTPGRRPGQRLVGGTAFAVVLADAGAKVGLWGRSAEVCDEVTRRHTNTRYLGDTPLPETIEASTDAAAVVEDDDVAMLAVPSQTLRANLDRWRPLDPRRGECLVSLMKGVELGTPAAVSEVMAEVGAVSRGAGGHGVGAEPRPRDRVRQPAACVVACVDDRRCRARRPGLPGALFRPYTDIGRRRCRALRGGQERHRPGRRHRRGHGHGRQSKASIITRGLAETVRLGVALGGDPVTFAGLAGLGDLVATCVSPFRATAPSGCRWARGWTSPRPPPPRSKTAEGVMSCRRSSSSPATTTSRCRSRSRSSRSSHGGADVREMGRRPDSAAPAEPEGL